jgi:ribosomal protein S18 acetylase RimI-like enzyme
MNELQPLPVDAMSQTGKQAIADLASKGYEVKAGLTREYAAIITDIAHENNILEYCPNDAGSRFKSVDAAEEWLRKGRAMYVLLDPSASGNRRLAGYGWIGARKSPHVPDSEVTFSLRISEQHQGKGLAAPFSMAMIEAAAVTYDTSNLWLETWSSNGGAVHIYHKLGFNDVWTEDTQRPTAAGGTVADTRIYMTYVIGL